MKNFVNPRFRERNTGKWCSTKDFARSMKAPDMPNDEKVMHKIALGEPYQNSLDHIGHNLMLRRREAHKETGDSDFNCHIRLDSIQDAFIINKDGATGTIREHRNN